MTGVQTCALPILGAALSFIGVILAIIALAKAKSYPPVTARKGMSIAALIVSVIGMLLGGFITIGTLYAFSVAPECLTIADPTAQSQCIQEKIANATK